MAVRVYVLLGKPTAISIVLGTLFLITHSLNISVTVWFVAGGTIMYTSFEFLDINICQQYVPPNRVWAFPATSFAVLGFDIILCALALHHAVKRFPAAFWRAPLQAAAGLASVIVRDNLVYFFLTLIAMMLSAIDFVPIITKSIIFNSIYPIPQMMLLTMIGPWMIISLRRNFDNDTGEGGPHSQEMISVAFASPEIQQEEEIEVVERSFA
ncbi:hypothetical protein CONPUDRAFT_91261 [Coniophora puteana RWD-64-598 SS2]|uniref:Uncharacterized protein n=1 Tax=Coniophora puteana (strain RWD-64-598) TaxID=741705 RepID=A0A5M3MHW7_CONPW|nr:uncharacterized protein CONPUDRAFT_91261 [Coniophora puteana RWD-64-598 SS2]EIW78829.1 hypothetical protein CONPUDRAFT_91261 [Coniophora puteana RWD-64-598 SS2]